MLLSKTAVVQNPHTGSLPPNGTCGFSSPREKCCSPVLVFYSTDVEKLSRPLDTLAGGDFVLSLNAWPDLINSRPWLWCLPWLFAHTVPLLLHSERKMALLESSDCELRTLQLFQAPSLAGPDCQGVFFCLGNGCKRDFVTEVAILPRVSNLIMG